MMISNSGRYSKHRRSSVDDKDADIDDDADLDVDVDVKSVETKKPKLSKEDKMRMRSKCNSDDLRNVECVLETKDLWEKFHDLETEMIITKTGRWEHFPIVTFVITCLARNLTVFANPSSKFDQKTQ